MLSSVLNEVQCTVCAKGALFIAHVGRFNHCELVGYSLCPDIVDIGYFNYKDIIRNRLKKHFSDLQLDIIEAAFEGDIICDYSLRIDSRMEAKCRAFYEKYYYSVDRLTAIMKNIISNNGTFKP